MTEPAQRSRYCPSGVYSPFGQHDELSLSARDKVEL